VHFRMISHICSVFITLMAQREGRLSFQCMSSLIGLTVTRRYVSAHSRMSNTLGNPGNLLEIFFSGLVCEFARLSLIILVTILVFQSVSVQNISRKPGSIDIEVSNPDVS